MASVAASVSPGKVRRAHFSKPVASLWGVAQACLRILRMLYESAAQIWMVVRTGYYVLNAIWCMHLQVRLAMIAIIALNILVSVCVMLNPYVEGYFIDMCGEAYEYVSDGEGVRPHFYEFVVTLGLLFIAIPITKEALEGLRELTLNRYFRPLIVATIALRAASVAIDRPQRMRDRKVKDRSAVLMVGLENFPNLAELMVRDPWLAIRSPLILVSFYTVPWVGAVLLVQMMYEFFITGWIQSVVGPLWDKRQKRYNAMLNAVSAALTLNSRGRDHETRNRLQRIITQRIKCLVSQWQSTGKWDAICTQFLRDGLNSMFALLLWVTVAWYVWYGELSPGEAWATIQLAGQATAPLKTLYNMQREIMKSLQSLFDLGQLCNRNYGVKVA